ncbi:MAG TPA: hypothetical protein VNA69_18925 [Thermoanaerobaculia bacterium]|nr:hypothetical protein [Thermoanaerobaculia bacterium]
MKKLVGWIIFLVLLYFAWTKLAPKLTDVKLGSKSTTTGAGVGGGNSCTGAAESASSEWGGGLVRFVNPPYDLDAWSSFQGSVNRRIGDAEAQCTCIEESCGKARDAMRELRGLVNELDTAIRTGGSPPSDAVQRQESIDRQITEAQELVRSGK